MLSEHMHKKSKTYYKNAQKVDISETHIKVLSHCNVILKQLQSHAAINMAKILAKRNKKLNSSTENIRPQRQHRPVCQVASVFHYHEQLAAVLPSLGPAFLAQCRISDFLVTTAKDAQHFMI